MTVEHPAGKPRVGTFVDYFNPEIMQRIGFTQGYGDRYDGPYAALVINNLGADLVLRVYLPGVNSIEFSQVPHANDVKTDVRTGKKAYWDWQSPEQADAAAAELDEPEDEVEDPKDARPPK